MSPVPITIGDTSGNNGNVNVGDVRFDVVMTIGGGIVVFVVVIVVVVVVVVVGSVVPEIVRFANSIFVE